MVPLPSANYNHEYVTPRPNTRAGGYVTLMDSSGENIMSKSVLLGKKIRKGYHDLRDMAEHVNEKIEKLLERYGGDIKGAPQV